MVNVEVSGNKNSYYLHAYVGAKRTEFPRVYIYIKKTCNDSSDGHVGSYSFVTNKILHKCMGEQ